MAGVAAAVAAAKHNRGCRDERTRSKRAPWILLCCVCLALVLVTACLPKKVLCQTLGESKYPPLRTSTKRSQSIPLPPPLKAATRWDVIAKDHDEAPKPMLEASPECWTLAMKRVAMVVQARQFTTDDDDDDDGEEEGQQWLARAQAQELCVAMNYHEKRALALELTSCFLRSNGHDSLFGGKDKSRSRQTDDGDGDGAFHQPKHGGETTTRGHHRDGSTSGGSNSDTTEQPLSRQNDNDQDNHNYGHKSDDNADTLECTDEAVLRWTMIGRTDWVTRCLSQLSVNPHDVFVHFFRSVHEDCLRLTDELWTQQTRRISSLLMDRAMTVSQYLQDDLVDYHRQVQSHLWQQMQNLQHDYQTQQAHFQHLQETVRQEMQSSIRTAMHENQKWARQHLQKLHERWQKHLWREQRQWKRQWWKEAQTAKQEWKRQMETLHASQNQLEELINNVTHAVVPFLQIRRSLVYLTEQGAIGWWLCLAVWRGAVFLGHAIISTSTHSLSDIALYWFTRSATIWILSCLFSRASFGKRQRRRLANPPWFFSSFPLLLMAATVAMLVEILYIPWQRNRGDSGSDSDDQAKDRVAEFTSFWRPVCHCGQLVLVLAVRVFWRRRSSRQWQEWNRACIEDGREWNREYGSDSERPKELFDHGRRTHESPSAANQSSNYQQSELLLLELSRSMQETQAAIRLLNARTDQAIACASSSCHILRTPPASCTGPADDSPVVVAATPEAHSKQLVRGAGVQVSPSLSVAPPPVAPNSCLLLESNGFSFDDGKIQRSATAMNHEEEGGREQVEQSMGNADLLTPGCSPPHQPKDHSKKRKADAPSGRLVTKRQKGTSSASHKPT